MDLYNKMKQMQKAKPKKKEKDTIIMKMTAVTIKTLDT